MREKLLALAAILGLTLCGTSVLVLGVGGAMTALAAPLASTQPPSPSTSQSSADAAASPTEATNHAQPEPPSQSTDPEQMKFDNLIDECMTEAGYPPSLMAAWRAQDFRTPSTERPWTITPLEERAAFEDALWGESGSSATATYEGLVENGGCDGYVVGQLYPKDTH